VYDIFLPSSRTSRFLGTRRHPDQAALAARLPLLGRRVPMRRYWRTRPIDRSRVARRLAENLRDYARTFGFGASMGARSMLERRAERRMRHRQAALAAHHEHIIGHVPETRLGRRWSNRPHLGFPMLIVGTAAGALFMFMFDPGQGRRRRALVRDKITHLRRVMTRDVPTTVEKRGRFIRGVAKGLVHDTTEVLPFNGHPLVDNETLVARVRSEVLRDAQIKAGEIHVDAYEGCVTLRGQLEHRDEIRRLVRETAHVEGVREVRNFLHTPGTPPPNKAAVYVPAYQPSARARR
jgi:hypothetical protein